MKEIMMLNVHDLSISFQSRDTELRAVKNLSFEVKKNEILGIAGESGSGKSVTALAILRLIDSPGKIVSGQILFHDQDLLKVSEKEIQHIRGKKIALIFQDSLSALNPVYRISDQLIEVLKWHQGLNSKQALDRSVELLEKVQIPAASKRIFDFPHQFSGGMCQRVMIAMALACEPELLIADEPTSSLDVTIQAEILQLLKEIQSSSSMSVILISHDLSVLAQMSERMLIMYRGEKIEEGDVSKIFKNPQHAYTRLLLDSIPRTPHLIK